MSESAQICWLDLHRIVAGRPAVLSLLVGRFGSAQAVFAASRRELEELPGISAAIVNDVLEGPDPCHVSKELDWLAQDDAFLVTFEDGLYPRALREIPDPPPLMFVRGNPAVLSRPQIAITGSRNPTQAGADNAHEFAAALCQAGLTVTSGLALGIDACAHRGALAASGATLAVSGTGADRVYPSRHLELAHEILRCGAIVSELPLGSGPRAEHFPRRNRILSGLSLGVLVVEAALHSGSLITARFAAEQGREVFAIPGSIHSPLARGCHALIRQGAKLVESAADVLEELAALAPGSGSSHPKATPDAVNEAS